MLMNWAPLFNNVCLSSCTVTGFYMLFHSSLYKEHLIYVLLVLFNTISVAFFLRCSKKKAFCKISGDWQLVVVYFYENTEIILFFSLQKIIILF